MTRLNAKRRSFLFGLLLLLLNIDVYAVDYFSVEQAQQKIFGQSASFKRQTLSFSDDDKDLIKEQAHTRQRRDELNVWQVSEKQQPIGWFVVDEVIGKHEYITYATAIDLQGNVIDIVVMSYRETHGGEVREHSWLKQFVGKSLVNPIKLGKDIDNISGATLSCRNITDGIRRLLVIHQLKLQDANNLMAKRP